MFKYLNLQGISLCIPMSAEGWELPYGGPPFAFTPCALSEMHGKLEGLRAMLEVEPMSGNPMSAPAIKSRFFHYKK